MSQRQKGQTYVESVPVDRNLPSGTQHPDHKCTVFSCLLILNFFLNLTFRFSRFLTFLATISINILAVSWTSMEAVWFAGFDEAEGMFSHAITCVFVCVDFFPYSRGVVDRSPSLCTLHCLKFPMMHQSGRLKKAKWLSNITFLHKNIYKVVFKHL